MKSATCCGRNSSWHGEEMGSTYSHFFVKLSSVNQFLFLIFVMFIFEKKIKCEVIRTVQRKVGVIFIK